MYWIVRVKIHHPKAPTSREKKKKRSHTFCSASQLPATPGRRPIEALLARSMQPAACEEWKAKRKQREKKNQAREEKVEASFALALIQI
ncbi:hypothetical protein B0I35DRAFT_30846 [Stachybotrys elegans]|uniref:Uncharacterized protein n=1 Tax=Stachybotrys elegans TaxID=80388 RepID=A0A8K0T2E0_9HYPO|nr:hypothetical protein B0I35DRAFT_30846 [Stachybotrys elegans]